VLLFVTTFLLEVGRFGHGEHWSLETSVNRSHHSTDADVVKKVFVC